MTSLKVLTINVWHGHAMRGITRVPLEPDGARVQRTERLLAGIARLSPDVILMQECHPEPGYTASLAETLGYDVIWQPTNSGIRIGPLGLLLGGREGIAILARTSLQLRKLTAVRIHGIGYNARRSALQVTELNYALAGQITLGDQPVAVVCTHVFYALPDLPTVQRLWTALGARGAVTGQLPAAVLDRTRRHVRQRDRCMARLSRFVATLTENRPVIIGGDFNIEAGDPSMQSLVRDNRLVSVMDGATSTPAPTWDPAGNPNVAFSTPPPRPGQSRQSLLLVAYDAEAQRPDHILVSESSIEVVSSRIVLQPDAPGGQCASDHYGILADLRIATALRQP